MNPYAPPKARVNDPPEISGVGVGSWVTGGLALFFAFCALFFGWTLSFQNTAVAVLAACLGAAAAVGLWLRRPWSRWIVYLISTLLIVFCAWSVWAVVFSSWPYESGGRSFSYLLPLPLLLMFGVATAVHVARLFRKR